MAAYRFFFNRLYQLPLTHEQQQQEKKIIYQIARNNGYPSHIIERLNQRSPTGGPRTTNGPRENFGGPWRNLDIICNFYVYYTVSLYSDSFSCHRHRIADDNKQQQISH
jgi:hypothetical protein